MGDAGQGGPVRLAILLGSIGGLILLGVQTSGGLEGVSASHGPVAGHGAAGRIIAVVSRRRVPLAVRRQVMAPRASGAAAINVAGATYLIGGTRRTAHGGRVPVASVLRRVGRGLSSRVAKLPTPVTGAAPAVVGDRLYAIGGRLANGKASDEIQEYDIATEHSVVAAHLPKPVSRAAALTLDGYVYVIGGVTRGRATRSILRFNPWRETVFRAGHLPVRAMGGAAAAVRLRRGYVVGASIPGASRVNFAITLRAPLRGAGSRNG
jgi:Kelch motif